MKSLIFVRHFTAKVPVKIQNVWRGSNKFRILCKIPSVSILLFQIFISKFTCLYFRCIQAKALLLDEIHNFVHEKITLAGRAISHYAQEKIRDGDVIMVYAW